MIWPKIRFEEESKRKAVSPLAFEPKTETFNWKVKKNKVRIIFGENKRRFNNSWLNVKKKKWYTYRSPSIQRNALSIVCKREICGNYTIYALKIELESALYRDLWIIYMIYAYYIVQYIVLPRISGIFKELSFVGEDNQSNLSVTEHRDLVCFLE